MELDKKAFLSAKKKLTDFEGDPQKLVVDKNTFSLLLNYHIRTCKPYCPPLKVNNNTFFFMGIDIQKTGHKKERILVK